VKVLGAFIYIGVSFMKTYRNLYPKIYDLENLYLAYRKARCGKRGKSPAADFELIQDEELERLENELREMRYAHGAYHSFYIHEPKKRLISAAPFRDRVVHHALCRIIEPIWERRFIHDSYANRVGKGTHKAIDRAQLYARKYKYFLQLDIRQFFPSIDHVILKKELSRLIRDEKTLWLTDKILESGVGVLSEEYEMVYFKGDDPSINSGQGLFAVNRPRGLPIGNLTSQFWANVYMNDFDHFIKRELRAKAYLRYVDDFLLFSDDKKELWGWKKELIEKLNTLRLTIHRSSAHVFPTEKGIPFLGFRIYPEYRLLKARKANQYRRHLKSLNKKYKLGEIEREKVVASMQGWINHVRYGSTWGLRGAILNQAFA